MLISKIVSDGVFVYEHTRWNLQMAVMWKHVHNVTHTTIRFVGPGEDAGDTNEKSPLLFFTFGNWM